MFVDLLRKVVDSTQLGHVLHLLFHRFICSSIGPINESRPQQPTPPAGETEIPTVTVHCVKIVVTTKN